MSKTKVEAESKYKSYRFSAIISWIWLLNSSLQVLAAVTRPELNAYDWFWLIALPFWIFSFTFSLVKMITYHRLMKEEPADVRSHN